MAEYTAIAQQEVAYLQPMIFTESPIPCNRGLVMHEDGTGTFKLSGAVSQNEIQSRCCCKGLPAADYLIVFHANIAVPEGGTPEEISMALMVDGSIVPATRMRVTPTAATAFFNIGTSKNVKAIMGCCSALQVVNASASQNPILVSEGVLDITRPDLIMSY